MSRISPFPEVVLTLTIILCGIAGMLWGSVQLGWLNDDVLEKSFEAVLVVGLLIGPVTYGVMRSLAFHPSSRQDMCEWLASTPWKWPQPLPFGVVRLVPEDAVIAGLVLTGLRVLKGDWAIGLVVTIVAFLAYCLSMIVVFKRTGVPLAGYGVGLALAGAFAFCLTPWVAVLFLVVCDLIVRWGIGESLRRFPEWSHQLDQRERVPPEWLAGQSGKVSQTLGWPHAVLHPVSSGPRLTQQDVVLLSLLIGAWGAAFILNILATVDANITISSPPPEIDLWHFYATPMFCGFAFGFARLMFYIQHLSPPISLWTRIRTRFLLLPRHDRVFIVPLLLVALGTGLSYLGFALAASLKLFLPVSLTLLALIALGCGPTIEEWRLTTPCRMGSTRTRSSESHVETR